MTAHVLVVEARFYDEINDNLVEGARMALEAAGATYEVVTVPGALEIPATINFMNKNKGNIYDAYVVLGCIIRGETSHYDIVCNESARGVYDLTLQNDLALGNGILTVENKAQAMARANPEEKNKGGAAAEAALRMLQIKRESQE